MNQSVAEEQTAQKVKANQDRIRKMKDRANSSGDMLKTIRKDTKKRANLFVTDDDQELDLTRVTKLSDIQKEDAE